MCARRLEATRLLKADDKTSDISVVALSSNAMQDDENKALEAGCDGYITKPIKVAEFVNVVRDYLH